MKCIICHEGSLEIVNSRKHSSEPRVWRRRKCNHCAAVFTTKELPDYDRVFSIQYGKQKSSKKAFEKALLLAQLFAAGGHIQKPRDLFWLAETIAMKAFVRAAESSFILSGKDYHLLVLQTLNAYDKLLGANFEARNTA